MFLLGYSYITATANKEYRPNLGPSCSYLDVATLPFIENEEDIIKIIITIIIIIIYLTANGLLPSGSGYNCLYMNMK